MNILSTYIITVSIYAVKLFNCLTHLVYKYVLRPDLKWPSVLANVSDSGRCFQRTDAALTKLTSPPGVRIVLGSRSVIAF